MSPEASGAERGSGHEVRTPERPSPVEVPQSVLDLIGEVQYQEKNSAVVNSNWVETGNAGTSYSAIAGRSMQIYVWGRIVSADTATTQRLLRTIRCSLRVGSTARVDSVIGVRNQPAVTLN